MGQAQPLQAFDPNLRFVRLRAVRSDGFVEFEFAIGEPELCVELIMPAAAYHEFCRVNGVVHLSPIDVAAAHGR
jgi:phenol/toluene 2-monooxygenase (NADH) P0/A0